MTEAEFIQLLTEYRSVKIDYRLLVWGGTRSIRPAPELYRKFSFLHYHLKSEIQRNLSLVTHMRMTDKFTPDQLELLSSVLD